MKWACWQLRRCLAAATPRGRKVTSFIYHILMHRAIKRWRRSRDLWRRHRDDITDEWYAFVMRWGWVRWFSYLGRWWDWWQGDIKKRAQRRVKCRATTREDDNTNLPADWDARSQRIARDERYMRQKPTLKAVPSILYTSGARLRRACKWQIRHAADAESII